ncbi:alpha/beta hydrolase [Solibacillus sp. CAU 1738]|uniref:intracellular short-chain-length polyhydroxyalkanoate depolymerase n=1 Tax=Solibacillus sp. CAU 1738 TaxID=3140363 RepID=UPI0032602F90
METLHEVPLPNGETMTYRKRDGGNEIIVLVHGNMTSSKHWDLLMESLDSKYTIFAPDLRGFGGSSYNTRITHIKDFSDDLKMWVDALELKHFTLIGWSTGGAVGMQFCADYAGICEKLILLASGSTRGYPFFASNPDGTPNFTKRFTTVAEIEQDAFRTIPMQAMYDSGNRAGLKIVWDSAIYTDNKPESSRYEAYVDDMLTQRNLSDVYHALNTFNISAVDNVAAQGTNQVSHIKIPVLVLYGDRDLVVPEIMAQEIIEDFSGHATVQQLKNCGHSPLVDDLSQLTAAIEQFISDEHTINL